MAMGIVASFSSDGNVVPERNKSWPAQSQTLADAKSARALG
jgi:hypothetical protein